MPTLTNEGSGQRHVFLCGESKVATDGSQTPCELKKHNNATLDYIKGIIARRSFASNYTLNRVDAIRSTIESIARTTCFVSVEGKEERLVNDKIIVNSMELGKHEHLSHGLIKIDGLEGSKVSMFEDYVNRLEFGPAQFQGDVSMDQCFDFPIQAYVSDTISSKYFVLDIVAGFVPIDIVQGENISLEELFQQDSPNRTSFGSNTNTQVFSVVFSGRYLKISASSDAIKLEMTRTFQGQQPPHFLQDLLQHVKVPAVPRQMQFNTNVQSKDIIFSDYAELKNLDMSIPSNTTVTSSPDGIIRVKIRLPLGK